MKTLRMTATALVALAVIVPTAQAGTVDAPASVDAPAVTTPTTTTTPTATAPTTATVPTTTTETTPTSETPTTTTTTTTTDGDVPTTVGDTGTPATTTTTTDDIPLDDLVTDIPDDVAGAGDCVTATCIPTSGSGVVPVSGAGASLPFTGIGDTVAPILLALVVLLAGIVAIRWAQLREAVARTRSRRVIDAGALVSKTGYAAAIREQAINDRARSFYGPRVA